MFTIVILIELTTIIFSLLIIGDTQGWWKKGKGRQKQNLGRESK